MQPQYAAHLIHQKSITQSSQPLHSTTSFFWYSKYILLTSHIPIQSISSSLSPLRQSHHALSIRLLKPGTQHKARPVWPHQSQSVSLSLSVSLKGLAWQIQTFLFTNQGRDGRTMTWAEPSDLWLIPFLCKRLIENCFQYGLFYACFQFRHRTLSEMTAFEMELIPIQGLIEMVINKLCCYTHCGKSIVHTGWLCGTSVSLVNPSRQLWHSTHGHNGSKLAITFQHTTSISKHVPPLKPHPVVVVSGKRTGTTKERKNNRY